MIVFHDFGISVAEYAELGQENDFPEIEQCPHCRGKVRLWRHGFYERNALDKTGEFEVTICRLKCPSCKKTVSIFPDFLIPHFQYTLGTVLEKLKRGLTKKAAPGYQLIQFYRKRFFKQLNQVEMFFRDQGFMGFLPRGFKEKAIKLLEMILAFGKATFLRRSKGYFQTSFMAL